MEEIKMKLIKVTIKESMPHSAIIEVGSLELLQIKVYFEDAMKQQKRPEAKRNIEKYLKQIEEIGNSLMNAV